mmetsp:Transcript_1936/g.4493  ORF Transcript_1936/g.4493 Transcript_1936/m.4493 type:complete len:264 (+) Transcript_1936:103-894(+)
MGNLAAHSSTSLESAVSSAGGESIRSCLKSLSLCDGLPFFSEAVIWIALSTNCAISSKSFSTRPRLVMAGAPMRRPWGCMADLSPGTVFLLQCRFASSITRSTRAPSTPLSRRSTSTRWFSVPPETRLYPSACIFLASACEFDSTWSWYCLYSGVCACFSATASAQIVWLCGPPWRPGKTAWSMGPARSYMMSLPFLSWPLTPLREKIMAPRGPRRDLWVVVVTTSANSKGSGTTLAATRPEMCAMSARRMAPHASAILRIRA